MKNVYIMLGCPGSGKTTWVKEKGLEYTSRDQIREKLGFTEIGKKYLGTKEEEEQVSQVQNETISNFCLSGIEFAIDDTNANSFFRSKLIEKLRNFQYKIIGVRMNTSCQTCINRRGGQVPVDVIRNMWERVQQIDSTEFDELLEIKGE